MKETSVSEGPGPSEGLEMKEIKDQFIQRIYRQ